MKKLLTICISCSLALAASAIAQQDEEQQQQKGKRGKEKNEAQASPQATSAPKEHAGARGRGQENARGQENMRGQQNARGQESMRGQQNVRAQENAGAKPETTPRQRGMTKGEKQQSNENVTGTEQTGKGKKERGTRNAEMNKSASPNPAAAANQTTAGNANANATGKGKKPDRQVVQSIKAQHQGFRAQPKPDKVPTVTFNQGYRIQGAEQWQGPQYVVFRNYHPEWHDQGWYRSHFSRVELIGGGYYYWNSGYWYPAWGYDSAAQYYAYDAPIYVGHSAEPPDRIIADVQGVLQQMGYYQGEVDGLLGPQTREALAAYQRDNGLYATEVIDEPTLNSLGMA